MRSLIITVAGLSSRFNRDLSHPVLKCLYHESTPNTAPLSYQITSFYEIVDEIVIVGGFKFEDLTAFCVKEIKDPGEKIKLVFNEHFEDWGSGYSLICGINAMADNTDEVVFAEGDLFFDRPSVHKVVSAHRDVLTINREPICSNKAVALYVGSDNHLHYIYDSSHAALEIPEPFTAIYNSAQIWKFTKPIKLRDIATSLPEKATKGTNLEIIQRYFDALTIAEIDIIPIVKWYNCNTVDDYRTALESLSEC